MFKKVLAVMLVLLLLVGFGAWGRVFSQAKFPDVPSDYWAYDQITKLVELGIVKGYPDGTFKPGNNVTRAEFATMVVLAKKLTLVSPARPSFKDVPTNHWAFKYVETAAKAGYLKGYPDGTFGPSRNITRQEIAAVLINIKGLSSEAEKLNNTLEQAQALAQDEKSVSKWAIGAITLVYKPQHQLLNYRTLTIEGHKFRGISPLTNGTRAECTFSIHRILYPPKATDVIEFAESQEPADLAGQEFTNFAVGVDTAALIYDGCIGLDDQLRLYPSFVKEVPTQSNGLWKVWEEDSVEKMSVEFHLRKGIKWSDGYPFTVKDLKFAWEVRTHPDVPIAVNFLDLKISKIETPDDYTIIYYFKEADLEPYYITDSMYPEHILREKFEKSPGDLSKDKYWDNPLSNGPFKLSKWIKGERLEFEVNPNWWFGTPLTKKVIQYAIPNTNTIIANLLAGKIDIAINTGSTASQANMVRDRLKGSVNVLYIPSSYQEQITFNCEDETLKDVNIRRALAYATDKDEINKVVFLGTYVPVNSFFDKLAVWDSKKFTTYKYDPNKAIEILEANGWKLGSDGYRYKDEKKLSIEFLTSPEKPARAQIVEVIRTQWKKVGIEIKIKSQPWGIAMTETVPMGKFQATIFAWGGGSPYDLTSGGYQIFHSSQIPTEENDYNASNNQRWSNPEYDKYLEIANKTVKMDVIIPNLEKAIEVWMQDLPALYLLQWSDHTYVRTNIRGYTPGAYETWTADLPFVWKEK